MLESIHFVYDGVKSVDMGLINVKLDGGMYEEAFLPSREIEEEEIVGRDKPYHRRVRLSPLEFELTFAIEDGYDNQRIREIARWLNQDYYKPFYTLENPDRIFYCMLEGDSSLFHNGIQQGYITLTMRCDSPFSYTPHEYINPLVYGSKKEVTTIHEDTFNNDMGSFQNNIKINTDNNIEIDRANVNWSMLSGQKWSDL